MSEFVLREDKNNVATLIVNRPEKLNALNVGVFEELEDHINTLAGETERVLPDGAAVEMAATYPDNRISEGGVRRLCHEDAGAAVDHGLAGPPFGERDNRASSGRGYAFRCHPYRFDCTCGPDHRVGPGAVWRR